MMFDFNFDKAIQATAFLLRREPHREMNYMRLLKILYTADRLSIQKTGHPITGARVAAMPRGTVLSEVYDLIRGYELKSPEWASCIQRNGYTVSLIAEPGMASLTRNDVEILEHIAEEHEHDDEWAMVEFTHGFEEWKKNDPGESGMNWIPFEDILHAVGMSEKREDIEQDAKTDAAFMRLFGA